MPFFDNREVQHIFDTYPDPIRDRLLFLRQLILDVAHTLPHPLQETLKWGEPSYLTKEGSTVRIHWKASAPDHYGMYFNCNASLIDTFRILYADQMTFQGNRAILFHIEDQLDVEALRHCIKLALTYHRLKHLPLLGSGDIHTNRG